MPVAELSREHNVSTALIYQWRAKFGGMDASLMKRLKELEAENARLKKMYAEERPVELRQEALEEVVRPSQRREMARKALPGMESVSGWPAKPTAATCYRYQAKLNGENAGIADWLLTTQTRKRWGFGLCFMYLRNVKGHTWNHKRVYRLYRELELNLRIQPRRRIKRDYPGELVPTAPNQVWSMDFMSDQLVSGKSLRTLNGIDGHNREGLGRGRLVATVSTGDELWIRSSSGVASRRPSL